MLSREDRAKQFLPFDALKGFKEALMEKEIEYVEKVELSEEQIEEISDKLNLLEIGSIVEVVYYFNGQYFKIVGNVKKIDGIKKQIIIDETKVNFVDIFRIKEIYIDKIY